MPQKLKDMGGYLTYTEPAINQLADALNGLGAMMTNLAKAKDIRDERKSEILKRIQDLKLKIGEMDPEKQAYIKQNAPDLWSMFSDPDIAAHIGKPHKGELIPAPVRPLTEVEVAARSKTKAEAEKLNLENTKLGEENTKLKFFNKLRESTDPLERLQGIRESVLSTDEVLANMIPEEVKRAAKAKTPGTPEYTLQEFSRLFQDFSTKVNPQSPKDVQGVRDWAAYYSGLNAEMPKTPFPRTLEGQRVDLEQQRVNLSKQTEARLAQDQIYQHRKNIADLSGVFSTRLLQGGLTPDEAATQGMQAAMDYYSKGKLPEGIPADLAPKIEMDLKTLQTQQLRESVRKSAQDNPELQVLLDLIPKVPDDQKKALAKKAVTLYEQQFNKNLPISTDYSGMFGRMKYLWDKAGESGKWWLKQENRAWLENEMSTGTRNIMQKEGEIESLQHPGIGAPEQRTSTTAPPAAPETFDNLDPIKKQALQQVLGYVEMVSKTGTIQQSEKAREWIAKARLFQEGKLTYQDLMSELP